jgi:membrane associated rhomboid family serine protease
MLALGNPPSPASAIAHKPQPPEHHADPASASYFAKKEQLRHTVPDDQLAVATYRALPDEQRCFADFHWWQLITHAFLHEGYLHLAGNLLFLFIFGARVNALLGDFWTALIYPLLAALAGLPSVLLHPQTPACGLGASGAIMGLAGMYFILFPVQRVFLIAWLRIPFIYLFTKLFSLRGFWMLVLWVGYNDLWPVLRHSKDHVGHDAHLGGFTGGIAIVTILLLTRLTHARGGDLISMALGRHAWKILGKPSVRKDEIPVEMLAAKAVDLNYRG